MALFIETSDPDALLAGIVKEITEGKIETWEIVTYNNIDYYTHVESSGQWSKKAYFKPHVDKANNRLKFGLHGTKTPMSRIIYAVYHGKFTQMILDHFEEDFRWASSSSKKHELDVFTPET